MQNAVLEAGPVHPLDMTRLPICPILNIHVACVPLPVVSLLIQRKRIAILPHPTMLTIRFFLDLLQTSQRIR